MSLINNAHKASHGKGWNISMDKMVHLSDSSITTFGGSKFAEEYIYKISHNIVGQQGYLDIQFVPVVASGPRLIDCSMCKNISNLAIWLIMPSKGNLNCNTTQAKQITIGPFY